MKKTIGKAVRVAVRCPVGICMLVEYFAYLSSVSKQGVRVSKKPRHTSAESSASFPSDILGDPMDQAQIVAQVAAPTFPDQGKLRSRKIATAVTPTHDKAFNKKPAMAKQSRIQQPK